MDQDTVVVEQRTSGERLIAALEARGFDVPLAFWAKPTEEDEWYLYLASPFVAAHGGHAAYRLVHDTIRSLADLWIKPLEVKVLRMDDSLTEAALKKRKPQPFPGMTRFGGSTLGGLGIDGAYIYPAPLLSAPAS